MIDHYLIPRFHVVKDEPKRGSLLRGFLLWCKRFLNRGKSQPITRFNCLNNESTDNGLSALLVATTADKTTELDGSKDKTNSV